MGNFQYTLRRESSWDGGFASRKAQPEIPNLHPNFAKHVQNASNCGVSIMKGIILWNSITCIGERWVVVHRHGVGCQFRERILVGQ
jgi:hypothetical protein